VLSTKSGASVRLAETALAGIHHRRGRSPPSSKRPPARGPSPIGWGGAFGAALLVGAVAGLVPALRAARMSPTEALWTV
jgi:hypothetical protein